MYNSVEPNSWVQCGTLFRPCRAGGFEGAIEGFEGFRRDDRPEEVWKIGVLAGLAGPMEVLRKGVWLG